MPSYPQNVKGVQIMDRVIARALSETTFRRRLLDDPKGVLRGEGLEIADDVTVVIHRNSEHVLNLVLPASPDKGDRLKVGEVELGKLSRRHPF